MRNNKLPSLMETINAFREALTPAHYALLRELIGAGYGYAPVGSERWNQLLELRNAGYLYAWQGVFYSNEAGKALNAAQ
jgi:hypothetical protein